MNAEQTEITTERGVDGKSDLGAHLDLLRDAETLFVARAQELIDKLILASVIFAEFPLVAQRVLGLHLLFGHILLLAGLE